MGLHLLIGMNTRVLRGWLDNKISAGQSGGVLLLQQLGQFHFFSNTKHIYLFISLFYDAFRFPLGNLVVLVICLNFLYFFIHKFNCFSESKILCVFEYSFCSFTVQVCLCVSMTYLHICLHIPLYFVCSCCLFAQDLYMFIPMLIHICVHLCFSTDDIVWMCLYKLSND